MAIRLEESDPTLIYQEGRGNYSEKAENSNSSLSAHALSVGEIKNSNREGLFILFY